MDDKFLIQTDYGPMRFLSYRAKKRRDNLGLSEQQVGERAGLPGITVKRFEKGQNVTIETLLRISYALDMEPWKLLKVSKVRRSVEKGRSMKRANQCGSAVGPSISR